MNPFRYERASDASSAVALLAQAPNGVFLVGGTNLVDHLKLGVRQPDLLIDITHLPYDRIEPHATTAIWSDDGVTLYDANQGSHSIRDAVATAFRFPPERVRVIARYVGGGFGSKVFPHPHVILTVMAAQAAGRPVKLALTRQQMFALVGYRTPTIQRIRLGADGDGRLMAIVHDVVE